MPAIELTGVTRRYEGGGETVVALDSVSLSVDRGAFVAIMGPSGSGKSTLLNVIGLLDAPDAGSVVVDAVDVTDLDTAERTQMRKETVGFVFQDFHLIPTLSAQENVVLPTIYDREPRQERARALLERVGLGDRLDHAPDELSGGQKQRVAIARSLINEPGIILADEPTGNLDRETGTRILETLTDVTDRGVSVVAVTHDPAVADHADRTIELRDGVIQ
ncbi:ABC-type transport system ATP-binding protein (probable substrate macrolides) [Natronomonas pharaonis DSM 2160]|uniref:ABC-type transport system ATP-binding protein (Probable substrate macrolides) n=1 Tax=Natronomonas pharaonis (strain ATCC 35678 / DSM 2160 / CIP 103997 / JCM 8858 / NBRC 14720 / NCIMB 2260 / Gabara) TaxID=348780 RepID=A0A1U7ETB8_NATPD|nr:ABC transporter ATP-binding protein [Natronomonas pharaonis]CAI48141.1 ABC-type transport system ATP-binding protein (probable substrate macrolides) [Natronomonas pharaonis DSM 2160]